MAAETKRVIVLEINYEHCVQIKNTGTPHSVLLIVSIKTEH
jgi:hypothetical protein